MPSPSKNQNQLVQHQHESDGCTVMTDEGDPDVIYFVDEKGQYYCQPEDGNQNLILLGTEDPLNKKENDISRNNPQVMVKGTEFKTATSVPGSGSGKVSYVLIVQEKTKPAVNQDDSEVDHKQDKNSKNVYIYDEEVADAESADEDSAHNINSTQKCTNREEKKQCSYNTCTFCSYTNPKRHLLLRHMKSHSDKMPYKCKVCERGFKSAASLQNHLNMHNGDKPHICKYCQRPFTTLGELVRHVRYKHTLDKPHKCSECDYASVEVSKLRRHIRCHTGERPFQCPDCTYASTDTFKLQRHMRTHSGVKPYKCNECNMCFTQSNSLNSHKLIHNVSEKPTFQCEFCPVKCGRKVDLRIHIKRLHSTITPSTCKRCGKIFSDRYSFKMHNETHKGEKCFKCALCPYSSTAFKNLKSHMLIHSDEKPFACDQCDQSFRQKQLLRRHQNLYHSPSYARKPLKEKTYTCEECSQQFAYKGNLIRHLVKHDADSRYHEKKLALKLGRQVKIKFNNKPTKSKHWSIDHGQQDTILGMVEDDPKCGDLVTLSNSDEQQNVVLEVIQLEDGTEQQAALIASTSNMKGGGRGRR